MKLIPIQIREFFHLTLLRSISQRFADRIYVLKGGICLRFFYNSVRFSEDIDFDISQKIPIDTLSRNINNILKSQAFISILFPYGVKEINFKEVKKTHITHRWKIKLVMLNNTEVSTKIEFSERQKEFTWISGTPNRELLQTYQISPFISKYYDINELTIQKIYALVSSNRAAARDLFDLHHLFFSYNVDTKELKKEIKIDILKNAGDKISGFKISDFQAEIIPFLPLDLAEYYNNRLNVERIKNECLEKLFG